MYLYVYFETGVDQLIQVTDRPVQGEYSVRDIADTLLGPEDTSCDCYYLDFDLQRTIPARFELVHNEPIRLLLGTKDVFEIVPQFAEPILLDDFHSKLESFLLSSGCRKFSFECLDLVQSKQLMERQLGKFVAFEPDRAIPEYCVNVWKRMGISYTPETHNRMFCLNDRGICHFFILESRQRLEKLFVKFRTLCGVNLDRKLYQQIPKQQCAQWRSVDQFKHNMAQLLKKIPAKVCSDNAVTLGRDWDYMQVQSAQQVMYQTVRPR